MLFTCLSSVDSFGDVCSGEIVLATMILSSCTARTQCVNNDDLRELCLAQHAGNEYDSIALQFGSCIASTLHRHEYRSNL